jgi:S1-C subfamily serine protease
LSRSNVKPWARLPLTVACGAALVPVAAAGPPEPPAVVAVRVWSGPGPAERATGTVVGHDRVLTVDHVLRRGARIAVDAEGVRRTATVLLRRPDLDVALLAVPGAAGPAVGAGDAGEDLRVLLERDGAVHARAAVLRRRVVARLVDQRGRPRRPSLELAVAVEAGDSGAPVVDADGDLVGVVYARSTRRDGTAYAVRGPGLRQLLR